MLKSVLLLLLAAKHSVPSTSPLAVPGYSRVFDEPCRASSLESGMNGRHLARYPRIG